jgi:hypothetical protein
VADAHERAHLLGRERRIRRQCAKLLQLGRHAAELAARRGEEVIGGRLLEGHAESGGAPQEPAAGALGRQRLALDRERAAHQVPVGLLFGRALHQDDDGLGGRALEILEEGGAGLRLALPALDLAQHDGPARGHHGQRGAEGEDGLGVELPGRALIEVEVAQSGLQGETEDRLDGLVLEDVLGSVQVVDRREISLGQGAQQRVVRPGGHAES